MSKRSVILAATVVAIGVGGGFLYKQQTASTANAPAAKGGAAEGTSGGAAGKGAPEKGAPGKGGPGGAAARPVPVQIATVEQKDVPLKLNLVGRTEAFSSVTLRSRVDGLITQVHYKAGQQIRKGQPMVSLDDRAQKAQVDQATANLARDRAQLEKAKGDLARQSDLLAKGFISPATLETFRATVQTLEATVNADLAALDLAKVNLSYTTIASPMNGVAGAVLAFPGGSVKANDTALVVLNQISPLYVTFSVPESRLQEIGRDRMSRKMRVEASLPGAAGAAKPIVGELAFIDNAVDASTGTIQMKAQFANQDAALTPGQFVEVSMNIRDIQGALLMPSEALQAGPNGNFVYVAKPDQSVEIRPVQTLPGGKQLLIVEKGLSAGEKVVTDGHLRLTPNSKWEVRAPAAGGKGGDKGGKGGDKGGDKGAAGKGGADKAGAAPDAAKGPPKDAPPANAPTPAPAAKG